MKLGNHQVQIKKELTSKLNLTLKNEIGKMKLEAQVKGTLTGLEDLRKTPVELCHILSYQN